MRNTVLHDQTQWYLLFRIEEEDGQAVHLYAPLANKKTEAIAPAMVHNMGTSIIA